MYEDIFCFLTNNSRESSKNILATITKKFVLGIINLRNNNSSSFLPLLLCEAALAVAEGVHSIEFVIDIAFAYEIVAVLAVMVANSVAELTECLV